LKDGIINEKSSSGSGKFIADPFIVTVRDCFYRSSIFAGFTAFAGFVESPLTTEAAIYEAAGYFLLAS
jgi:hypothetical protein